MVVVGLYVDSGGLNMDSGNGGVGGVRQKEMGVNLSGVSVIVMPGTRVIRGGVDVLKRRNEESQQECHAGLDSYRATHH